MISNYLDFITESKLELLLEAKIVYSQEFIDVLDDIDSDISSKLISYKGKEMDVDRNYIDINKNKVDSILFKPQDKVDKVLYKLVSSGGIYDNLSTIAQEKGLINNFKVPYDGSSGIITKTFTLDELIKLNPNSQGIWTYMYDNNQRLVIFQFDERGETYGVIVLNNYLTRDVSNITPTEVNVGRFIRAFLKKLGVEYTDKSIEDFVDKYKDVLELKKNYLKRFREVKGEEIKKWYFEGNYEKVTGNLGGSCMRFEKCQDYFDIYTENPERISMVILMSVEDPEKISGRALLWLDDKGRKFMDRIYTIKNTDITLFKEYCYKNNYYHKNKQSYDSDYRLVYNRDELNGSENDIQVTLKKKHYNYYPFMDTMKYYEPTLGIISNRKFSKINMMGFLTLVQTDGSDGFSCEMCNGVGIVNCPECDGVSELSCNTCGGSGENDDGEGCEYCHGGGMVSCYICDGRGEFDCPECS